jgi:hypothetical protein
MRTLSQAHKNRIDVWLQTFSLMFVPITLAVGVWQYVESNEREFKKALWEYQLKKYAEICEAASSIATNPDAGKRMEAETLFWKLYYGDGRMVVDQNVHGAMSGFAKYLKSVSPLSTTDEELAVRAYAISTACRASLEKSWQIPLSH